MGEGFVSILRDSQRFAAQGFGNCADNRQNIMPMISAQSAKQTKHIQKRLGVCFIDNQFSAFVKARD